MTEKLNLTKSDSKRTYVIAQEIKLAKVLAGNNKTLRDRALKRLKRWFQFRSQSTPFTENDFMRIWKGLFYAMWMSDKPLLQEECAEMIASLVHLTTTKYSLMFFKCGLQTLGNEWFGIDQLRLDKFLMFVRRLLRQGFMVLKNDSWNLKTIKEFNNILSVTVLNVENSPPIGLTMHFTEVYLEELAKVSEGDLKPNLVTELVSPFVKQLALLQDNRQITSILRYIFRYLIKQSDMGIEYEEKFKAWKDQGFPGRSVDAMEKVELCDEDEDEESNQSESQARVLDPRAGHVDVVLPQLKFIPKQIIEILNQNKFLDGSNSKSRKAISTAIEELTQLSKGQYPLGIKKIDIPKDDGYSTKTRNAVNRLIKFENKLLNKTNKKRKKENENNVDEPHMKRRKEKLKTDKEEFDKQFSAFIKKSENKIKMNDKKEKHKNVMQNNKEAKDTGIDTKKLEINRNNDKKLKKKNLNLVSNIERKTKLKQTTKTHTKSDATKDYKEGIKSIEERKIVKGNHIKSVKKKIAEDEPIDKNYECTFERNSGTWFVYDDDSSTTSSTTSSILDTSVSYIGNNVTDNITPSKSGNPSPEKISPTKSILPKVNGDAEIKILPLKASEESINATSTPTKLLQGNDTRDILFKQNEWDVPLKEGETEVFIESKKYQKKQSKLNNSLTDIPKSANFKLARRRSLDLQIVKNPFATISTPGSSKKVKIALNLNQAQEIHEHVAHIKSSPGIPFDANKKPSKPLLKRHTISPVDPFYRRKLNM